MGYGGKLRGGFLRTMFAQSGGGLGHGDINDRFVPTPVEYFKENDIEISDISAGAYHTIAVDTDGKFYIWGKGEYGVMGTGYSNNMLTPYRHSLLQTL